MQVHLFGSLQVATTTFPQVELRPTAARLFAFLLLHRADVHMREVVAEFFWQESDIGRSRRSLNTTLWQLRSALGRDNEAQSELITTTPEQIRINQEAHLWLDVARFEEHATRGLAHPAAKLPLDAIQALEEAVALYRGDLLTGFYDDWALSERERLRMIYLRCLTQLMEHHHQQNELDTSIDYAQRILLVEPWREDVHRTLMSLYAEAGRRACALEQYRTCRQMLADDLDVVPLAETEALYGQLLADSHVRHRNLIHQAIDQPPAWDGAPAPTLAEATQQLQAAMQKLELARQELKEAKALVEHLSQRVHL